jgi:hypothetical protein
MKKILLVLLVSSKLYSQDWRLLWQDPKTNFYELQVAFNEHWKDKDVSVRGKGYKQYKRWEAFTEPRVYPSGDLSLTSTTWENYQAFLKQYGTTAGKSSQITSTTWMPMGPFGPLTGLADNGLPRKAGRDNFITFHPSVANTFWAGSPAGGLWKTTNGGASWTTNTDFLSVIGCTDLAIDPTNPNIMYLATGDGYWYSTWSVGVLKSTDGGATWNPTSLTFPVSQKVQMRRIIIDPSNTQNLLVATILGTYRSTNAAATWSLVNSLNTYDLEYNAASSNTVYASGLSFSVSTNGGASFTQISNGIPVGGGRTEIAVTPANPNVVYVIKSTLTETLQGVYRSLNAGTSFSTMATSPNILSSDCFTPGTDGQGNYDLTIAASPLNANEVVVGGINIWRSMNGGNNWTNIGCAYGTGNPPFIHADHHELEYTPAGILYGTNDGGIYTYTGTQWNDLTSPRNIAQIYKFGLSSLSPNKWISGHQDNGSNIYDNGLYKASLMADGMDCFIDRTNDQNLFASKFNGGFNKSTDGGATWNTCVVGMPGNGAFVSPWKQDPVTANILYAGKTQMYRSTNYANSWTQAGVLAAVSPTQFVTEFAIAPSNNQILYATHGTTGIFKSIDGAATWTNVNNGLPVGAAALTYVTIDPTNPNNVWVTFSGYSAANKVWKTVNGGTSWSNITYNLPNLPANCSVYETGSANGRIYVGMDVGVYYITNAAATWTLYNTGLPNTPISDLEISPASPTKLRAATFGRGVFQVDIVPSAAPPITAFNFVGNQCVLTSTLYMNDNSTNSPTSWSWSVTPSAGVVINGPAVQNPTITFANSGTYSISMIPTNGFGSGPMTTQTVSVFSPTITTSASASMICSGQSVTLTALGAGNYTWQPYNMLGSSASYTPNFTITYTVTGYAPNGCMDSDTMSVYVTTCTGVFQVGSEEIKFSVFPNPTNDYFTVLMNSSKTVEFNFEMIDATGKQVLKQTAKYSADKHDHQFYVAALPKGIYFLKIIAKDGSSQQVKILKD